MSRIYVGVRFEPTEGATYERFRSHSVPTFETHGAKYNAVIGPFSTRIGALAMVHFGHANPHMGNVANAERIGRMCEAELTGKGDSRFIPYQ